MASRSRSIVVVGLCGLAALSGGCGGLRPGTPDAPFDLFGGRPVGRPVGPAAADPAGERATPAGLAAQSAQSHFRTAGGLAPAAAPPVPLPPPNPLPAGPHGPPPPAAGPVPGQPGPVPPGTATPPVPGPASLPGDWGGGSAAPAGPHVRTGPTAAGGLLNLAPNDQPADRVIELAEKVKAAEFENRTLLARIRELEGVAQGREVSLIEAVREVEAAAAEVGKARADLEALRKDLAALRERLRLVEKEDIDTLRAVIAGLEKLVAPRPPTGGTP